MVDKKRCDFQGWATKVNLKCSDGRTIMPNAFKDDDGRVVPLVFNHRHDSPFDVLGQALLENRPQGVWAYCDFNDTESGQCAKVLVEHGDVKSLSICANDLTQNGGNVMHGKIRELSLVLAGANPGAKIEDVFLSHGEEDDGEAAIIYYNEEGGDIMLTHGEEEESVLEHAEEEKEDKEETVKDVFDTLTEKQKTVVYALIGQAVEDTKGDKTDNNDKGDNEMKHNVFDNDTVNTENVLTHADGAEIIKLAKRSDVGSLQHALKMYAEEKFSEDTLQHGFDDIEVMFPEYKDVYPGMPEMLAEEDEWVASVIADTHKTPFSRIRTRQTDIRDIDLAYGHEKGKQKKTPQNAKFIRRTTDPQTVYRKDKLERDDIVDFTEFDIVAYQYQIMRRQLNEALALAILIGDGLPDDAEEKIHEEHIRPIWKDDELYTIHYNLTVDGEYPEEILDAISLSGDVTDYTPNYKYVEAILAASLLSREKFKGTGVPVFYTTRHLVNLMLLARDLNGRRIYNSKEDLARALNVKRICEVEQFENKYRYGSAETHDADKKYKLKGLFVNLADYNVGSTKGGEITKFEDFDIDFNQYKYLIETRLSGALTKVKSAVALEERITIDGNDPEEP